MVVCGLPLARTKGAQHHRSAAIPHGLRDKKKGVPVKLRSGTHLAQQSGCRTIATGESVQSSSWEPPPLPHSQSLVGAWGGRSVLRQGKKSPKQGTDQRLTCAWGLSPLRARAAATTSASPDSVMYRTPDELTRTPRGSPLPLRRREDLGVPSTPAAQVTPPDACVKLRLAGSTTPAGTARGQGQGRGACLRHEAPHQG